MTRFLISRETKNASYHVPVQCVCVCVFSKRQRKSRQAGIVSKRPTCQPVTTAVKFGTLTMTRVQEPLPSTDNTLQQTTPAPRQGRVSPTRRKKKKKKKKEEERSRLACTLCRWRLVWVHVCLRCPGKARGNCYGVKGTTRLCDV